MKPNKRTLFFILKCASNICREPKEINQQQFFPSLHSPILELYSVNDIDAPKHQLFAPILSRLKTNGYLFIFPDFTIQFPTASFSFDFAVCYLFKLDLRDVVFRAYVNSVHFLMWITVEFSMWSLSKYFQNSTNSNHWKTK